MRGRAALGLTTALLVAAGCGGGAAKSDPDAIAAMLEDAAEATADGDGDEACGHLTEDAQRQALLMLGAAGSAGASSCSELVGRAQVFLTPLDRERIKSLEATDVRVSGTSGSATLRTDAGAAPGQGIVVPINVEKADGDWRISGFGRPVGLPGG